MHSTVRDSVGIAFEGGSYEQSFVLADVVMDWPLPDNEVQLFFSPAGLVVVAPLPGGHHRIVATVDRAPEHPSVQDVMDLLSERGRGKARFGIWSGAPGSVCITGSPSSTGGTQCSSRVTPLMCTAPPVDRA
jgi:hypothetical protein